MDQYGVVSDIYSMSVCVWEKNLTKQWTGKHRLKLVQQTKGVLTGVVNKGGVMCEWLEEISGST